MIDIKLKKDAVKKGSLEETIMVKLKDTSEVKEKVKRKALNIGVAIDISSSMNVGIEPLNNAVFQGLGVQEFSNGASKSRMEQAKMVVLKTIDSMHDGDIISITAFNDRVHNIVESVELTKDNRYDIRNKIMDLSASGTTDLYAGWLASVTEVASKLSPTKLNRILLVSDGDITTGIRDKDKIAQNVRKISTKGVSTSTFGIGSNFNEDLLQAMADASSANSYYVEDEEKMNKVFEDEFNDFTNIAGTDVSIEFELNDGVELQDNLCDFNIEGNKFLIPNIRRSSDVYALFKLKLMKAVSSNSEANLGVFKLTYKDNEGKVQKITKELEYKVVSEDEYEAMLENEEVIVQDILMTVAKTKREATKAIDNHDVESATKILEGSRDSLRGLGSKYKDVRIQSSLKATEDTLMNVKNNDVGVLRKELAYQVYATTRSMV